MAGSPPRLWGKRVASARSSARLRFTPTPVGKTRQDHRRLLHGAVHPHACGENPGSNSLVVSAYGSPPRLWGKLNLLLSSILIPRFTPTPVGKTATQTVGRTSLTVHPHACGENFARCRASPVFGGSPPRLWGKRSSVDGSLGQFRFTPTPVGKTRSCCRRGIWVAVHPHACGENAAGGLRRAASRRFTPTPVGKTPLIQGNSAVR